MARRGKVFDVLIGGGGTLYLVIPLSRRGLAWVDDHLPEAGPHLGRNPVVEHRFIRDILHGMLQDGLEVGRCWN